MAVKVVSKRSKSKRGNPVKTKLFPTLKKGSNVSSNLNKMVAYKTKSGKRYMVISEKKRVFKDARSAISAMGKKN